MLKQLNGTKNHIDVTAFRQTALNTFKYYVEVFFALISHLPFFLQDYSQYKGMTASLHMLIAHVPDWVE